MLTALHILLLGDSIVPAGSGSQRCAFSLFRCERSTPVVLQGHTQHKGENHFHMRGLDIAATLNLAISSAVLLCISTHGGKPRSPSAHQTAKSNSLPKLTCNMYSHGPQFCFFLQLWSQSLRFHFPLTLASPAATCSRISPI